MLRMCNAELAGAVIRAFDGRLTLERLHPLKAVAMWQPLSLNQSHDHPGLVQGQARVNAQVWNLADQALVDA